MDPVTVVLEAWDGQWGADDLHGNFKAEVALYAKADPMETLVPFAEEVGIPVGVICRYILAKWSSEGSAGLLELGPSMVDRLWRVCAEADEADSDEGRLAAFAQLRDILSWLRIPIA